MKLLLWPTQRPAFNHIEMLWHDLEKKKLVCVCVCVYVFMFECFVCVFCVCICFSTADLTPGKLSVAYGSIAPSGGTSLNCKALLKKKNFTRSSRALF